MPPQVKRRRRQSSVLSFFQQDPPTPPSIPSPTPTSIPSPTPPSIPSAPPSAGTESPVKPCSTPSLSPIHSPAPSSIPETVPPASPEHHLPLCHESYSVCVPGMGVDITPSSQPLSVWTLPGVDLSPFFGSPVTPKDAVEKKMYENHVDAVDEIEEVDDDEEEDDDEDDDEDNWKPVSRLSRSRRVGRRSARLWTARQLHENQPRESTPDALPIPLSSDRSSTEIETMRLVKLQPSRQKPKKSHSSFASKEHDNTKAVHEKKLHPFFTATAAAVSSARERKRPRTVTPSLDAWQCPSATIHINAPKPLGAFQWKRNTEPVRETAIVEPVDFFCYAGNAGVELRPIESIPCESTDTWAERYKRDGRIDVINGAATKELVDWLRNWYETRQQADTSDDSQDSYVMPNEVGERERVAIITGPVGCGKSTIISNAARQLGLSILEINASVCRTGKRIREIIGEALSTHRVTHRSVFQTFKPEVEPVAKTLILFEEVDELHDDEKGFWSTIQKLAASSDCRRPIVCTANSFTAQMRQFFVQSRATIEEDLDRLLVNSRVEQLMNPVEYKLIKFQSRSERQATAVINRVCSTETADAVKDAAKCLAVTCRDDTRKAINLLHFWGAKGLVYASGSSPRRTRGSPPKRRRHGSFSLETQVRIGTELVEATHPGNHAVSTFHLGSFNYINSQGQKQISPSKSGDVCQNDEALDAWCTSLEAMSYADVIEGTVERERSRRNFELSEESFGACMHTDILQASETAREIDARSLQYSESYLMFGRGTQYVNEIAKQATSRQRTFPEYLIRQLPLPRIPVLLEYLPILRTMSLAEEKASGGVGSSTDGQDRPTRRTRARTRQGRFLSLDLDPITIFALKKTAIRIGET